jgi:hypothetical protein
MGLCRAAVAELEQNIYSGIVKGSVMALDKDLCMLKTPKVKKI